MAVVNKVHMQVGIPEHPIYLSHITILAKLYTQSWTLKWETESANNAVHLLDKIIGGAQDVSLHSTPALKGRRPKHGLYLTIYAVAAKTSNAIHSTISLVVGANALQDILCSVC